MGIKEYALKDLLVIKNGKDYKGLSEGKTPVYGTGGIMTFVNDKLHSGESILLPRKGTLDNIIYVNGDFWTVDTMYWSIIDTKNAYPKYLYLYLSLLDLSSKDSGSTLPSMTFDSYYSVPIKLPSLDKQKEIADFIFRILAKIKNNNKINAELESMAKTFYDYWFLQFEFPNEEGKPYKSSGGKMVWNEELKREIPEGWKGRRIGDILIEADKSKVQVNGAQEKGQYPFFTSGESILSFDDFFVDSFNIFLNTGGNPDIKAYMGKCAYSTDTWCVSAKEYSYVLYYYFLKLMPQFEQLFFAGSGLKHLQKDVLKNIYILLPDDKVLNLFNDYCVSSWRKIANCLIQNKELSSLRDFLLPLLMNGQVTFKENKLWID